MKNSILGKARWLRDVALATSKNNGARVAREWLKYAAMFVMLFTIGVGNVWGTAPNSGTAYSTNSKNTPEGWTLNGSGSTSYWYLNASSNYILTDEFCQNGIASIVVKARTYGGPSASQRLITIEWVPTSGSTIVLGTVDPTNTTLTDKTLSSFTNTPPTNTSGKIKISCKSANSSKGSGVSQVTINYTSGSCSGGSTPTISVTPTSIDFGTVDIGNSPTETFVVKGSNLTGDITLTGASAPMSLSATTITKAEAETVSGKTITVTYTPTSTASTSQTITLASSGATNKSVSLAGQGQQKYAVHYFVGGAEDVNLKEMVVSGGKVSSLPEAESCDAVNYPYFVGWSTTNFGSTTSAPSLVTGNETISSETTYYAVFAAGTGGNSSTSTIDFEGESSTYSDWTFTNLKSQQTGTITANGGTYYGTTGGATASVKTINKIASPTSLTAYVSKQTTNTTSSTWYIRVSSDGSTWTNVKSQSATSMTKGSWVEMTADLTNYSDVYVQVYYTGSTAVRNIDDLTLTIGGGTTYSAYSTSCQACVAPDHVNISGRWDRFGGEAISLTATPYDGSDQEITTGITGYQWQKYYNSTWNDIAGATSATYTKSNCDKDDSGSYRCVVSTGATCSTASNGFQVKVYVLESYTGGTTTYNFTRIGDTQAGTCQINLAAGNHEFKFHADNDYYGNNGTINEDVSNWVCSTSQGNLTIAAGLGGTFTINMEYSTSGSSSVLGEPEISVTYPRKTIYLVPNSDWLSNSAKFAYYYYGASGVTGWTDFIAANECGMAAEIPQWNGITVIAVRFNSSEESPGWNGDGHVWNQTSDIALTADKDLITITGWNNSQTYTVYSTPTYTISYAAGSTTHTGGNAISGSKENEIKTCGTAFTLPSSAVFTATGYTQTGWATEDGGSKEYDLEGNYTTNAAQTFYPFWTVNSHTLTWDFNGGSSSETEGIDYTAGGSVNYDTTIDYPSDASMSKAGYTFTGWSSSPATMPDENLTITAQWSVQSYNITWSVNNQTWTHGVTDANNQANHGATVNAPAGDGNVPTGTAMPCGTYTFMGWSAAITPTSENGGTAPADLFTTTSPAITKETTFYAVFAEQISEGQIALVTSTSQLTEGTKVYISSNDGDFYAVAKAYSSGNNVRATSGSVSDDVLTPGENACAYTIGITTGEHAGYTFYDGTNYLCASSTTSNYMVGSPNVTVDGYCEFNIDITSGSFSITSVGNTSRGTMQFNKNGDTGDYSKALFSCYASASQKNVKLYKKTDDVYSNYKTYCDDTKAYVNYNPAGGTTSCTREAVTKGTNYTVCSSVPTKTGYTFQGWLSNETTPQTYQPNATISNVQNDIVLTAQWTATTYTITYNGVKTGAENTNPISYTVEDLPINLVAATHDQWRFDGWTDDNAGNADITTIPAGTTGNQSFTAHWTQRYAVTWYEESTPTVTYFDPGTTLQFPADPSAPASCSEKKFVGWMVGTITGETDDKPTFVTAGEVNADAAYHAVWANFAGSAIAAVEDNTFTQSDVSRETYCGISNGLQSVGKYVQNQSIWNASQMTGVHVKIKVYHVSNDRADVLRISLINSSGEEVVGTDLTTSKLGNSSSSAGYSSNVTLTPTTAVTGYKVSLKTKNSSGTSVGKVTREVVPAYSKYSTSCCDNNVAAPSVTATATRNSITLSWANVTDATGYKVTINGGTHDVTTAACTYTASGLNSGTDYAWTVIATYNPANYCGAIPTKNTTTTLSVYGVTYNKNTTIGSGTVTMSPMPSDASTYVVGENVTAAAKPATCTNSGYTFNGWNTEPDGTGTHVDAGGTIAMVEGGLTLYAEWVAKRAYYVDRMHGQGDQTIEIGGKTYHCYYGDGYHITPSPSDQKSGDACQAPHYRFVRWLTIGHINADGTQKDTGGAVSGGVQRGTVTDGETYYAIWEEEIE